MRFDCKPIPYGNNRIEYSTLGIGKRLVFIQCLRFMNSARSSDKYGTICFKRNIPDVCRIMHFHQVEHPGLRISCTPRSARAKDRITLRKDFCLNKQIAECRMGCIGSGSSKHYFGITGYFKRSFSALIDY